MESYTTLMLPERKGKSYVRSDYSTDTVYTFFRYQDVSMSFAKKPGTMTRLTDFFAQQLLTDGLITQRQLEDYTARVCAEYYHKDCHPEQSPEDIYAFIRRTRRAVFGGQVLTQAMENARSRGCSFDPTQGIDQRGKKQQLLESCGSVIFVLTQPELFFLMEADVAAARKAGKAIRICTGGELPTGEQFSRWLGETEDLCFVTVEQLCGEDACLLFYGEEGLLHCRDLSVDAVVHAVSEGYHAQALCNSLGSSRACVVYIPKGLDITPWVPLSAQTRLTYWHLAGLWEDHGDGIYDLTPQQLYSRYPRYFVNVYDNGKRAFPITAAGETFGQFDESKDAAVGAYLNSFRNISYKYQYFDEDLNEQPICRDSAQRQKGILVHSIRVKKARNARIIRCEKGVTPREMFARQPLAETALASNFLFFLTPKLGVLYNDLRDDRPMEQADAAAGHLDYMLCSREGKRVETFPLFRKTCIAMTEAGEFLFFNFRLGGGSVRVADVPIRWESGDVDAPASESAPVRVYTPYGSVSDEDADRQTYRKTVGAGRVNFVILQDKVGCIRKGDVVLPSVGVVISLTEAAAQPILEKLSPLENGYYNAAGMTLSVQLDAPEGVDPTRWQQVQWAYGGGMSLILDGEGLCDGEHMQQWFRQDGWMSPLSRQTQESVLHQLVKHPRTAIGVTKNGDLVILVFSGRTWRSSGADYREMIAIARRLYPDIQNLMNVDGGGSAMLGMVHEGSFMELSCPATSTGSCAGMVRPINTLFYIPAEKENEI